mmetsp:Transcript_12426/g.30989  ORF Transcript_12426/g.30989 Transcript_12426/m.30989 type:complete len:821 (-) Transcript_12426:82-2544(-)
MAGRMSVANLDDQERLLDEATAVFKEQAFHMGRAIESDNLRDALKHSSNMICELRTSLLSPKNYYELYTRVFDELQNLAKFFRDKSRHNRKMSDLYESVQHAGNILPRLYLLISVGSVYIASKEAPAKDILKDLSELCKGVQHPMRGLFLRFYLSQMCKDKLPDTNSDYEGEEGGDISDAFEFLMTNFTESNRLWVRLQHQGAVKDKARREVERYDLRVLVGTNLVRMSQLEGLTQEFYVAEALPKILEQVVQCKDVMAQQYLLDSIIHAFPDEYHMVTLDQLLTAMTQTTGGVDLRTVMCRLMERLKHVVENNPEAVPDSVDIFGMFRTHLQTILERPFSGEAGAPPAVLAPLLELQSEFLNFTLAMYDGHTEYVDAILESTVLLLTKALGDPDTGSKVDDDAAVDIVVTLLSTPIKSLGWEILDMQHFTTLIKFLTVATQKKVAIGMVDAVLESDNIIEDSDQLAKFLSFIQPVMKDMGGVSSEDLMNDKEFIREQQQVAKIVHIIQSDDTDVVYKCLETARKAFGDGGDARMAHTLIAVVSRAIELVPLIQAREVAVAAGEDVAPAQVSLKRVFGFIHKTLSDGLQTANPHACLRLWLAAANAADTADSNPDLAVQGTFEPICYEFLTQALITFEEEITDSRQQADGITVMVGSVSQLICLEEENYDNIAKKVSQHGAKLLKKPMQCRAVCTCSHLFWSPREEGRREGQRVRECLQKCLKIADVAVQSSNTNVGLFVEVLDKYLFYFTQGCDEVTPEHIQNLLTLCAEHVAYAEGDTASEVKLAFRNTVNYVKRRKAEGARQEGDRFHALDLSEISV